MAIHLRSAEELEKMHRAGLFVHEILTALRSAVKPGISTMDLEKLAEEKIAGRPGKAAFKGYRGYPCVLCTSVNSEIVHGIPSPKRKLREGDIVSIDFGMEVDGYYADSAVTVPVGQIRPVGRKLPNRDSDRRIAGSRDRQDARRQPARRCRPRRAELGRAEWLLGGARVSEKRDRDEDARRAQPAELR